MSAGEMVWAYSFTLTCVAGLAFRLLPRDGDAALRGVAAGLGMAVWLAAVVWVHFGPR